MLHPFRPTFRDIPYTGILYVMDRAFKAGYSHDASWANLGQGAPEINALPDAPERHNVLHFDLMQHEYAPIHGDRVLREKVAALYNFLYRQGKASQYTYENVSICGGGRIALARIVASLGEILLGHFLPDYTAYEELLSLFKAFTPIPLLFDRTQIEAIHTEIEHHQLNALLLSNPCNPTGQVIAGKALNTLVNTCRDKNCSLILDEFYSHYIYPSLEATHTPPTISAASYVDDVNRDPVLLLNGLTKNWRYPGWRISWIVAPKAIIQTLCGVGSFLDGGANHPLQHQAIPLLEPDYVLKEAAAIQKHFREKRDYMIKRLAQMGIDIATPPDGTFYIWANLEKLPPPLNEGFAFFEACLKEKVITVPGLFFDINPHKKRKKAHYAQYARLSYGPDMETIERGLNHIEKVLSDAS